MGERQCEGDKKVEQNEGGGVKPTKDDQRAHADSSGVTYSWYQTHALEDISWDHRLGSPSGLGHGVEEQTCTSGRTELHPVLAPRL